MQITIKNLTPKEIEIANFMIARAVEAFNEHNLLRESWDIKTSEIEQAKSFQEKLLKAFLKPEVAEQSAGTK